MWEVCSEVMVPGLCWWWDGALCPWSRGGAGCGCGSVQGEDAVCVSVLCKMTELVILLVPQGFWELGIVS